MVSLGSGLVPFPHELEGEVTAKGFRVPGTDFVFSNHNKPLFPGGLTKGDLGQYYLSVAEYLLPHLRDRPLSMSRYPDGIGGNSFYEKRAPSHTPDWVTRIPVPSDSMGGIIPYVSARTPADLLWLAAMACIEMHPFHTRGDRLETPDYAIFDFDPAAGSHWDQVVAGAIGLKAVLDGLGLRGYPKLSGSKGLHVYLPLEPVHDYRRIRRFVEAVGKLLVAASPTDFTMEPVIANRSGMIYIDVNRNAFGQTVASAYSVRPLAGAPVSAPLDWSEVGSVENGDVTMANLWDRLERHGDLFAPVVEGGQVLDEAERALGVGE